MGSRRRIVELARRIKQPLQLITAFYVLVGFCSWIYGAIQRDLLAATLGFFFISGAFCAAFVIHTLSRLAVRVSAIGDALDELRDALHRIEVGATQQNQADRPPEMDRKDAEPPMEILDLTTLGPGDPSRVTAATLDRSRFPRLVSAMADQPPADSGKEATASRPEPSIDRSIEAAAITQTPALQDKAHGLANKNLLRLWRIARREGDLTACRNVYATVADTADTVVAAEFKRQLDDIVRQTRQSLQTAFAQRVREEDYEAALAIGLKINELFADEPMAAEFARIKPHLLSRIGSSNTPDSSPSAAAH